MDPNFRGVVIGSCWRLLHRIFKFGPNAKLPDLSAPPASVHYVPQPQEIDPLIRRTLLYFDQIVLPSNNILPQGESQDFDYLIGEGMLVRDNINVALPASVDPKWLKHVRELGQFPNLAVSGGVAIFAETIAKGHRQSFLDRENKQPGAWTFATVGKGLDFANDATGRGYLIELNNVLPSPAELVPYADIIDFRKREHNALQDQRAALDQMYTRITRSSDPDFAAGVELRELQKSVAAVLGLLDKSRIPFLQQNLTIKLNPFKWVEASYFGRDVSKTMEDAGFDFPWPQLAGFVAGAGITIKRSDNQTPIKRPGVFQYTYEAAKAGIVDRPIYGKPLATT
jgi:Family of unknown function (DUF6236)